MDAGKANGGGESSHVKRVNYLEQRTYGECRKAGNSPHATQQAPKPARISVYLWCPPAVRSFEPIRM